jgi:hypothetical protein
VAAVLPVRSPDAGPDETSRRVVLAGWLLLCVVPFQYVFRFGVDCPFLDEWKMIPVLVGERPLADWLTAPDSHRYYLGQVLWWLTHQIGGHDFRASMYVSAWAFGATAWLLLRAVRAVRGHTRLADLFIPAVILHEAGGDVLLNGYDLTFALPALLAAAATAAIAGSPNPSVERLALVAVLLVAMAWCGSGGQLMAAPPAIWLAWAGWRTVGGWRAAALALVAALPLAVLVAENAGHHHGAPPVTTVHPLAAVRLMSEALGGAIGPLGYGMENAQELQIWPVSAVLVGAVVLAGAGGYLRLAARTPAERVRAVGLLAALLGGPAVLLALGLKRSFLPPGNGFTARYCLFTAHTLVMGYIGMVAAGWRRPTAWQTAVTLFAAAAVLAGSVHYAELWGAGFRHHLNRMWYRSQTGESSATMAADACPIICAPGATTPAAVAAMADGLEACRRHRIGPYRWMRTTPAAPSPPSRTP